MKRIAVLGSTGSIGRSTLEVIRQFPERFSVTALAAHSNTGLLAAQVKEFKPALVCISDPDSCGRARTALARHAQVLCGLEGLAQLVSDGRIDMVVMAISGASALLPLLWAIENRKHVAMANKEALVMAGPLVRKKLLQRNVRLIPIDSEQSAIWQCLEGQDRSSLKKIYLTASGGPFRRMSPARMKKITVKEALAHPRWKMGEKITVDSATLMNKGLEIIETMCLFGVQPEAVEVLIHPESVIHSMVEFCDGSILAQLSEADMRIPIQYALSYPKRLASGRASFDFPAAARLTFEKPDHKRFPCLGLALRAAKQAGTMPAVLNAANEAAVDAFLSKRIPFQSIAAIIEQVMDKHGVMQEPTLEAIAEADARARTEASRLIQEKKWKQTRSS
ncbi:MAG: 1-deoxy-D-xylulose-5-phosphate reductoisomerase [Candidatus Omnitrophica bacterium]|nr:1-deoxy-D-xylulose-5-phosphate reductoisomerase [Candidatus Omnitrophota bacterium]